MLMELMDGYTHPVLSEDDFIWLTRAYMGDEAADYLQELIKDTYQAGYDTASDEAADQIDELNETITKLEELNEKITDLEKGV